MNNNELTSRVRLLLETKKLSVSDKEQLLTMLIHLTVVKARNDFYTYLKLMCPYILPEKFRDGRHIKILSGLLQETEKSVAEGRKGSRKTQPCVSLPPGGCKSVTCSQVFPTWCLGRHPNWYILAVGHTEDFAIDNFGRKAQDIVRNPVFGIIFPELDLREDVKAAGRWYTEQKGVFLCAGAGKSIAGRRAHIAILDDVISEQTAKSDLLVKDIIAWYPLGLLSRLLPDGCVVHVGTRWRMDDLIGFVLENENKKRRKERSHLVFSIPALLDSRMSKYFKLPIDTSYWPEYWPTENFIEKRDYSGLTPTDWACLYMQDPIPEKGAIIKMEWCKEWEQESLPDLDFVLLSLDTAGTSKKGNDATGYSIWGVFRRNVRGFKGEEYQSSQIILIDGGEERLETIELLNKIKEWNEEYSPDTILVENAPVSLALTQELQRRGYPIVKFSHKSDKESRMKAAAPFFFQGRVWFPKRQWAKALITKLIQFPKGKHDDFPDCVSQAVIWLRNNNLVGSTEYKNNPDDWEDDDGVGNHNGRPTGTYWSSARKR